MIVPTCNRAHVLKRALDSVLAQTMKNFELLVVDDGSTDDTDLVLAAFSDSRLRVIRQKNRGVSAARNTGLAAARGHFLALLDSDDAWEPEKLACQIAFMRESGFSICQTEEKWVRRGKPVNPRHIHTKKAGWILPAAVELCLISPSCVMFARDVLAQTGNFCERLPACEDYDLWLRLSLKFPVGLVPRPLVIKYGGHGDQLSRRIIGLDLYRVYALLRALQQAETAEQKQILGRALREKSRIYRQGCIKNGNLEEVRRISELTASFAVGSA